MKISKRPFFFAVLGLYFAGVFFAGCGDHPAGSRASSVERVKLQVPDFSLPLFGKSEETWTLSKILKDRPVVLVFWASWCQACQKEVPALNELHRQIQLGGPLIVAVNVEENDKKIRDFSAEHNIHYAVLSDRSGKTAKAYQVSELPTVILLAKGGQILYYGFRLPKKLSDYFG